MTPVLGWWAEESPVGVVDPAEVHAVYRVPLAELLDPAHRVSVRHPSGWTGPGFLIGPEHDLVLWGFTAGIISRLFDFPGGPATGTTAWCVTFRRTCCKVVPARRRPSHTRRPTSGAPVNLLDWVLLVVVVLYAVSGYWQGFITGAFATVGLLIGGVVGVWLAPTALGDATPSILVSLAAVFIVIVCASLGQAVLQVGGARLRDKITWQPARAVDAAGGAVLSGAAALLVAWALGVALSGSGLHGITPLVQKSKVLAEVNRILPAEASSKLSAFNDVVGTTFFPRYLEPFAPERIVPVPPGPRRMLTDPDVQRAAADVVRIRSTNRCGQGIEGSGFVYAPTG